MENELPRLRKSFQSFEKGLQIGEWNPNTERARSDVGSWCAADREDPTSQKRTVVEA
jgi:hypothetical protein